MKSSANRSMFWVLLCYVDNYSVGAVLNLSQMLSEIRRNFFIYFFPILNIPYLQLHNIQAINVFYKIH